VTLADVWPPVDAQATLQLIALFYLPAGRISYDITPPAE
jgi:hypothetical protein